jgi:hypothetical protein
VPELLIGQGRSARDGMISVRRLFAIEQGGTFLLRGCSADVSALS